MAKEPDSAFTCLGEDAGTTTGSAGREVASGAVMGAPMSCSMSALSSALRSDCGLRSSAVVRLGATAEEEAREEDMPVDEEGEEAAEEAETEKEDDGGRLLVGDTGSVLS